MARRPSLPRSRTATARRSRWPSSRTFPVFAAVALLAYLPAWHGGLLWDDDAHLTRPALQSIAGLWRIWFDIGATQQYYPVAHTGFWLLYRFFGYDTLGYHLVNIGLHAMSAWLLWSILRRLEVPGALLAAFLFLLHPVQVESVAWISELKNTLSTVLFLAAASFYLRLRDDALERSTYLRALLLFVLAVLSKASAVVWPAVMLAGLWWYRRPMRWGLELRRLTPFLVCGAVAACVTVWVERTMIGAQGVEFRLSFASRFLIAGRAIWFYLGKLVWPANLAFVNPRWRVDPAVPWQYLFPAAVAVVAGILWRLRQRMPATAAAFLAFCAALGPALGLVDVYPFRYSFVADHFQYLATIPACALAGGAAAHFADRWRMARWTRTVAAVALSVALFALTWRQAGQYVDADTLYRTTLERNAACWLCLNNLAEPRLHGSMSEVRVAVEELQEALRLHPDAAEVHNNLGGAFQRLERWDAARAEHETAARLNPLLPDARFNLGVLDEHDGRPDAAIAEYRRAIALKPDYLWAHNNLAIVLQKSGRLDEALVELEAAVTIDPEAPEPHFNLAAALEHAGRLDEAAIQYRDALRLRPDDAEARARLDALSKGGRGSLRPPSP